MTQLYPNCSSHIFADRTEQDTTVSDLYTIRVQIGHQVFKNDAGA